MAPNTAAEEAAPLLDEKVRLESDAAVKGPEVQVDTKAVASSGRKVTDFLSNRSTYYWIAFIAQFCHITMSSIGYGFSVAYDRGTPMAMGYVYIASLMYSGSPFFLILSLIRVQYKKGSEVGPKRILAGKHYICTRICALLNTVNFFYVLLTVVYSENPLVFEDPVRPIVTPLAIGFIFVAAIACMKAARITRLSAQNARGTELVNDPEYRVPAWHLATMDESQIYRKSDREVQLPA